MIVDDYEAIARGLQKIRQEEGQLDDCCEDEPAMGVDDEPKNGWSDEALWAWTVKSNSIV